MLKLSLETVEMTHPEELDELCDLLNCHGRSNMKRRTDIYVKGGVLHATVKGTLQTHVVHAGHRGWQHAE